MTPRLIVRLRVWMRRSDLDRALAEGADPSTSEELRLRATQLTDPEMLSALASSLEAIVDGAGTPRSGSTSMVELRRRAVIEARAALLGLAQRLRDRDTVGPRAAAMVSFLVRSGDSPLYTGSTRESLRAYALRASSAIDDTRQAL